MRSSRSFTFWLRLGIGLGVLALVLRRVDLSRVTIRPGAAMAGAIVVAVILLMTSQALAALRWQLILGSGAPEWLYLLRLYLIGAFFSLFLPTAVGGDALRAALAARTTGRTGSVVASVLVDRLFGVAALLGYGVLGVLLVPALAEQMLGALEWRLSPRVAALGLGVLAAVGIAAVVLLRNSVRLRAIARDGLETLAALGRSPARMGSVLLLAIAVQACIIALWYVLARGVGFTLQPALFLIAVPVVSLGAMLPVTFAGLGIREGVWVLLLAHSGLPEADVVAFSLLYFGVTLLVGAVGGLVFVLAGTDIRPTQASA